MRIRPSEVRDMYYWELCLAIRGYYESLKDDMSVAILNGYYSGYYNNAKRPKAPSKFIEALYESSMGASPSNTSKEEMENKVEDFKQRFNEFKRAGVNI